LPDKECHHFEIVKGQITMGAMTGFALMIDFLYAASLPSLSQRLSQVRILSAPKTVCHHQNTSSAVSHQGQPEGAVSQTGGI
jgi:hypothetical protein